MKATGTSSSVRCSVVISTCCETSGGIDRPLVIGGNSGSNRFELKGSTSTKYCEFMESINEEIRKLETYFDGEDAT